MQIHEPDSPMRSKLFVPAIRPELFAKALNTAADAVCFDLEDAVPPNRKSEAREHLHAFLTSQSSVSRKRLLVRVNSANSADFAKDLHAVGAPSLFAIALPKVETVAEIQSVAESLSALESARSITHAIALLITVESPRGLRRAAELAACSPRICGLQLGFADLLEPLGISSDNSAARQQIRLMLRLAAGESGLDCYEAAYPLLGEQAGFLAELESARELGYAGASCIHPSQIEIVNRVFTPTVDEIKYAESVIAAAQEAERQGQAVIVLNGKMIDRPFLLRAKAILRKQTY